ncbi:MAG: Asp-tRNA(Asn)/Glu-tRNA(Gln) amidotransferase subunit GatB [Gemmatimonadota bacterium]|nr:MAG: Asp-tRNA(Asn)/Glu-tRNA(Gln) amidotransferase subunit GatB [Gemmatimonadota bacterium]
MSPAYEMVIGLEIHVQLKTRSKMFCGCGVEFGAPPNTHVCPVCLGLPGALPVVNQQAVELAVLAARALNCQVHRRSVFARKNYFYPDLPKGYQISQYDRPLATGGWLEFTEEGGAGGRLSIHRLHVEEDSGKSLHDRFPRSTAVDLNRAGVPLVEIVTEPQLRTPAQARAFLGRLKQTLEYLEVSDCNMEEGSLRVDANVSVRPAGSGEFMPKTEVKNMNSFSQLEKALGFEAARHVSVLQSGGVVEHQTMLWDPLRGEARPMRGKEEVHDYRYFPEPDLPTLEVSDELVEELAGRLPEMPWEKERRFVDEYRLPAYDAEVLSASRTLADLYEAVAQSTSDPKEASNWVMGEVLAASNDLGVPVERLQVDPEGLAEVIGLVAEGTLSHNLGKQVFRRMVETGKTAEQIMEAEGLRLVSGGDQLEAWISEAVTENPTEVERYRKGEEKLLAFFIGQVMRKSQGKADPGRTREALLKRLDQG